MTDTKTKTATKRHFRTFLNPVQLHESGALGVLCCVHCKQILFCTIASMQYNHLNFL